MMEDFDALCCLIFSFGIFTSGYVDDVCRWRIVMACVRFSILGLFDGFGLVSRPNPSLIVVCAGFRLGLRYLMCYYVVRFSILGLFDGFGLVSCPNPSLIVVCAWYSVWFEVPNLALCVIMLLASQFWGCWIHLGWVHVPTRAYCTFAMVWLSILVRGMVLARLEIANLA